ncbi:MAG: hypothetical protein IT535_03655 [Bauldia sp.]|nr:hypothetical protein [Bauldia sp.]
MVKGLSFVGRLASAGLLAALGWTLGQAPAYAQDAAFGRDVWLSQANCADCHGWLADGQPEDPRAPRGANLRDTVLTEEQLVEVILCGRPGTGMPHFDPRAYTDARCYGLTREQLGDATPGASDQTLTNRHAVGLARFILADFAGKGPPTSEDCTALLGEGNARCAALPRATP